MGEFTQYEKDKLYYAAVAIILVLTAILALKNFAGSKTVDLAKDWEADKMYILMNMGEANFTPVFIAPDNTRVEPQAHISYPYATYTIDTSEYHKGTWKMQYPNRAHGFSYEVKAP